MSFCYFLQICRLKESIITELVVSQGDRGVTDDPEDSNIYPKYLKRININRSTVEVNLLGDREVCVVWILIYVDKMGEKV